MTQFILVSIVLGVKPNPSLPHHCPRKPRLLLDPCPEEAGLGLLSGEQIYTRLFHCEDVVCARDASRPLPPLPQMAQK